MNGENKNLEIGIAKPSHRAWLLEIKMHGTQEGKLGREGMLE